jgi:hypothetical protein
MPISEDTVACAGRDCTADGAQFRIGRGGALQSLAGYRAPDPASVEDAVRLRRGTWRYVLLPGLVELELEESLRGLPDISVALWPEIDRYDLHVEHTADKKTWRVDVKDWTNPVALAKRLAGARSETQMHLVVPNRRRWQVTVLREALEGTSWKAVCVSEFVAEVRRHSGRRRPRENR